MSDSMSASSSDSSVLVYAYLKKFVYGFRGILASKPVRVLNSDRIYSVRWVGIVGVTSWTALKIITENLVHYVLTA